MAMVQLIKRKAEFLFSNMPNVVTLIRKQNNKEKVGCRHSSVDSCAPSILSPWVQLQSTPSTLLSFVVKFVQYLCLRCEKRTKINKKRPGLVHFNRKRKC